MADPDPIYDAVLHHNCLGCLSRAEVADGMKAKDSALILLAILRSGVSDLDHVYSDLCFFHKRLVDDAARAIIENERE